MPRKPADAGRYPPGTAEVVRSAYLYLATKLGDLLEEVVVVGGLVPYLLVPPETLPVGVSAHVGSRDMDLGLSLALLDHERYKEVAVRLREAGFQPDANEKGNPTRQRWVIHEEGVPVVPIDFLMAPSDETRVPGRVQNLEQDFGAVIVPGLRLAFRDRVQVLLAGKTLLGERVAREVPVWVAGPGAFVVLKALAFRGRGYDKDAYDLHWLLANHPGGVSTVVGHFLPLLAAPEAREALQILQEDFLREDHLGPMRASRFLHRGPDPEFLSDVVAVLHRFVTLCDFENAAGE